MARYIDELLAKRDRIEAQIKSVLDNYYPEGCQVRVTLAARQINLTKATVRGCDGNGYVYCHLHTAKGDTRRIFHNDVIFRDDKPKAKGRKHDRPR